MSKSNFKYVIQTELKLNTGSLNKLIGDIKDVDTSIKAHFNKTGGAGIRIPVSIDKATSINNLQTEIKQLITQYNMYQAPTIKIKVGIDKTSEARLKSDISTLKHQINNATTGSSVISVNTILKVNRGDKEKIQKQVGNIKSTMTVGLKLDQNDLRLVQSQVKEIRQAVQLGERVRTNSEGQAMGSYRDHVNNRTTGVGAVSSTGASRTTAGRPALDARAYAEAEERKAKAMYKNAQTKKIHVQNDRALLAVQEKKNKADLENNNILDQRARMVRREQKNQNKIDGLVRRGKKNLSDSDRLSNSNDLGLYRRKQQQLANAKARIDSQILRGLPRNYSTRSAVNDPLHILQSNIRARTISNAQAQSQARVDAHRQAEKARMDEMNRLHNDAKSEDKSRTSNNRTEQKSSDWDNAIHKYGGNKEKKVKDLEMVLRNPDLGMDEKQEALKQLKHHGQELARTMGHNLGRSFEIFNRNADGTISRTKTLQYEFTKWGEAIERGDRSFGAMARNVMAYSGVSAVFYGMAQGIRLAVTHMAEFEGQMARVQMIATDLRGTSGELKSGFSDWGSSRSEVGNNTRRDVFKLAQKYGMSSTENVLPVYQDVMSRTDLTKDADGNPDKETTRRITDQILKYSLISLGPNAKGEDIGRISQDMLSLYQGMYKDGGDQHVNQMDGFIDFMTTMNNSGVNTNNIMDTMSESAPDAMKKGIDIKQLAAMLGAYNLSDSDATGSTMTTMTKTFFNGLAKYQQSPYIAKGLEQLGIDPKLKYDQDELLNLVIEKYHQASNNDKVNASMNLANQNGKGGNQGPRIGKMLDATGSNYYKDFLASMNDQGQADSAVSQYVGTLIVKFGQLKETLNESVGLFAELGALDGLKTVMGGFKIGLSVMNYFLDILVKIGDKTEALGFNISGFVVQILALAGALKLVNLAMLKLSIGGSVRAAVGGTLTGLTSMSGASKMSQVPRPSPTFIGPMPLGRGANTISQSARNRRGLGRAIGTSVGWMVAGGINPRTWSKTRAGRNAGRLGGNVAVNLFGKTGTVLKGLIPNLSKFVGLLARLSLIGGVLATGAFIGSRVMKAYKNKQDEKRSSQISSFEETYMETDKDGNKVVKKSFSEDIDSWMKYNKEKKDAGPSKYASSNSILGGIPKNTDKYSPVSQSDEMKALNKKFSKAGIELKQDGRVHYNLTGTDNKEYDQSFAYGDEHGFEAMKQSLGAGGLDGEAQLAGIWDKMRAEAFEYEKELIIIDELTKEFGRSMNRLGYDMSTIDMNFMGAEGSTNALASKIEAIEGAMSELSSTTSTLEEKRKLFADKASDITKDSDAYRKEIIDSKAFSWSESEMKNLDEEYQVAFKTGDVESILGRYKTDDDTVKNWKDSGMNDKEIESQKSRYFALDGYLQYKQRNSEFLEGEKQTASDILAVESAIQEKNKALKEYNIALTVSLAKMELFNAKLQAIQFSGGKSQTLLNLADTDEDKIKAGGDLLKSKSAELGAYRAQLASVQSQMSKLKAGREDEFSLESLYDAGEGGLTEDQNAYKEMLERQYSIHDNINSTTVAMKEQADAIKDMILNSDKYADVWDRVQGRIQMVKDINRQLADTKIDMNLTPYLSQVRSAVTGESEISNRNSRYASIRDNASDDFEKLRISLESLAGDEAEMKKAYEEINSTMGSEFDSAFIEPLKDLIANDLLDAGNLIHTGADKLDSILNYWATNITSGMLNDANATFGTDMSSATSIGGFSGGSTPKGYLSDSEAIDAYIEQQFGYKKGSKQATSMKKQMGTYMTPKEMASEARRNVTDTGNNGTVHEYGTQIDSMLKGTQLAGYGNMYVKAGNQHNIDPRLLASISMAETGGDSKALRERNNVSGEMLRSGGLRTFDSKEDSIMSMASFLRRLYFDNGKDTIPEIQKSYAPSGAQNDPTGLNNNWVKNVTKYYSQLSGIPEAQLLGGGSAISGGTGSSSGGSGGAGGMMGASAQTQAVAKHYTSGGYHYTSKIGDGRNHKGVDINLAGEADRGAPVFSFLNGKIGDAGYHESAGNYATVVQEDGSKQKFFHMNKKSPLKKGDSVTAGQQIGEIGNTGDSSGSHLHYEMWDKNGKMLNPEDSISQWASGKGINAQASKAPTQDTGPTSAEYVTLMFSKFKQMVEAQIAINSYGASKEQYNRNVDLSYGHGNITDVLGTSGRGSMFASVTKAREDNYTSRYDNTEQLKQLAKSRKGYVGDANSALKGGHIAEYKANKSAVESIDKLVKALEANNKKLGEWDVKLAKQQQLDPTLNGREANKFIRGGHTEISNLRKKRKVGSVDYYRTVEELNGMNASYMTTKKKTAMMGELWGNTGSETRQYNTIKRIDAQDDINLMFKKMKEISKVLKEFAVGSHDWYETLEDAVAVQQQLKDLEQQRLTNAQSIFEMTGGGLQAYVAQKAYTQSKDYVQTDQNLESAKKQLAGGRMDKAYGVKTGTYKTKDSANKVAKFLKDDYNIASNVTGKKGAYRVETDKALTKERSAEIIGRLKARGLAKTVYQTGGGSKNMDQKQQLATMQIIAGLHDQMIQQMNDYRQAVVGAFKAGALSLDEYISKLSDLRDVQAEQRDNAIKMVDSISQGFEQSLSSALSGGMMGDADSTQGFMDGIKQVLATTVSDQLANTLLNNTGLQTVMTDILSSITTAATTGSPDDIVNMFNDNNYGDQIQDAIDPFIPLIEQIVASTEGMFAIMKNQVFNAPEGFKVDQYLYDQAKGESWDSVKNTQNGETNEAGSPIGGVGSNTPIVTPPQENPPSGVPGGVPPPANGVPSSDGPPPSTTPGGEGAPDDTIDDPPKNKDKVKAQPKAPPKASTPKTSTYTVKRGDTLGEIGQKLGIPWRTIAELNGIKSPYTIQPGQKLKVTGGGSSSGGTSSGTTKTARSSLNMRSSAGYGNNVMHVISKGAKVQYLGMQNGWAKIKHGGKTGFVGKSHIYHSGGIAGMMNFANANKLKSNEVEAIMQRGEIALQPKQLSGLLGHTVPASSGGGSGDLNINVSVDISGGNYDQKGIESVVETSVEKAMSEFNRQQRLGNLSWKGTSY